MPMSRLAPLRLERKMAPKGQAETASRHHVEKAGSPHPAYEASTGPTLRPWLPAVRALALGAKIWTPELALCAPVPVEGQNIQMLREKADHVVELQMRGEVARARTVALSTLDIAQELKMAPVDFLANRKLHLLSSSAIVGDFDLVGAFVRRGAVAWGAEDAAQLVASKVFFKWPLVLQSVVSKYLPESENDPDVSAAVQKALVATQDPVYILRAIGHDVTAAVDLGLKFGSLELAREIRAAAAHVTVYSALANDSFEDFFPDTRFVIE